MGNRNSNFEDTQLLHIGTEQTKGKRVGLRGDGERLHRRTSGRNQKIKRGDLVNVLRSQIGPMTSASDLLEDETIPGKAIVLKMPEKNMRTYFIPLPVDLDVRDNYLID